MYFDTETAQWSDKGVTTISLEDGKVTCATNHLTDFAGNIS